MRSSNDTNPEDKPPIPAHEHPEVKADGKSDDLRLHPRLRVVQQADIEIRCAVGKIAAQHELTYGEIFGILGNLVSEEAKYMVRAERHPSDPEKKGGEL